MVALDWTLALSEDRASGWVGEQGEVRRGGGRWTQRGANECHCTAVRGGAKNIY